MTIYISGPIAGVEDYRFRFACVERALAQKGWRVISPARLPDGLSRRAYMAADLPQLLLCDAVFMMAGWSERVRCTIEESLASYAGLRIYYALSDVPNLTDREMEV